MAIMNPNNQPTGLLGRVQNIGSGLLGGAQQFAGRAGQAVAPVAPDALKNIADMARFYTMAQAQQPYAVTAQDLDKLRPITPASIAAQLPQLRAAEQESLLKPETERMRQGLLQARIDAARAPISEKERLQTEILQARLNELKGVGARLDDKPVSTTAALGAPLTPQEIDTAPTIEEAAQGDFYGRGAAAARNILGFVGIDVGEKTASARDYVLQTNKEMQVALTKDLGGRLTKVVKEKVDEILPRTGMVNVNFASKANRLVEFSNQRIQEVMSEMPYMNQKEQKEARDYIDVLARQTRKYEAMIEKSSIAQPTAGPNSFAGMTTEELLKISGLPE